MSFIVSCELNFLNYLCESTVTWIRRLIFLFEAAFFHLVSINQYIQYMQINILNYFYFYFQIQYIEIMENQNLRKRLYQNLSQRPLKHTFLLESQTKDPKASQGILKPKIIHQNIGQLKQMSNSFVAMSPKLLKSTQIVDKKKALPKQVQLQKLSKEAKTIVEDGKYKNRSNLKPNQIFAFYDTFPQMIQDFFYLNRVSHPYDYQIVSYAKRNQHQYMTISSQGVTLYHDKQAQFLTKEEWLQDQKTYFKLQKIDFFNQYKLSKNFMIWKSKMKRHYMKSMSSILSQKLFLTFEHPRKCLKQVREISLVLQDSLPLLPSEQMEPLNWKQLLESSNNYHAHNLVNKIKQLQSKMVQSLEEAIDLQIKNFKESNKIRIEGLNNKEENKQGYVYSQQAILRKQYKRILKLIKLAENILLESKLQLIKQWIEKLLQRLMEINQNNLKDEWITVNFVAMPPDQGSSQIKWIPTQQNFVTTFTQIVNNAINCICQKHQKIINNEIFAKYRNSQDQSANKDDRYNSLKNLIQQTEFHNKIMAQIQERMAKQFEYVLKEEMQLKKFADIYKKHKQITSFEAIIQENTAAEISSLAREWKQDNQQMQQLPDRCCGMIKFDYSLIRKSMMNVAHDSYIALFSLLPTYLNKLCNETSSKVNSLLKPISIIPTDETLVQFIKAVKRASEQIESINEADKQTKQLLMLLEENRTPNIQFHRNNNKKLNIEITELKSKTTAAQAMQNQRLVKFKKGIEESIKKIRTNVKDYVGKLQQIEFDQKDLDADTIIQRINTILIPITQLNKQANNLKITQAQLSLPQTDLNQVYSLYKRAQVFSNLWKQKKLWYEFKIGFYSAHYYNFDCQNNRIKWEQFNAEVSKIKQYTQDNQFLNQLENDINEVDSQIQLVKTLQSKSLNQKSWTQISDYLNFELEKDGIEKQMNIPPFSNPKDELYTIKWLKDNQICKYKQKIQLITKKSQKQSHLINTLAMLKNYINSLSLQFVTKKRQLILLARNQQTFQQLSDHLTCLLDILNQDYSQMLIKEAKYMVKHYEYVIQILQAYCEFGKNWQKYQQLLDLTKHHSKQLSKQSKDFSNLEAAWKKIIKSIVMQNWSKKMYDQSSGANPNKNTLKSIHKTFATWQQIKKGVEDFLDKKRSSFHHYFYFTDDQLLTILTNPQLTLNQIVPIIYDNIKQINLSKDLDKLLSVVNIDNEELKLNKAIIMKLGSQFQQMLKNLEEQWKKFIVTTIKKVFSDFVSSNEDQILRTKIISENVTQIISAFEYITWVKLAEQTYLCPNPVGDLRDWINIQNCQIKELYLLLKQSNQPKFQKKITQLLLQATYLREKTQFFEQNNVKSLECYEWERTLKLCDDVSSMQQKIYLKAFGTSIVYGGQFLPSSATTFITPQTQRNYLNILNCISQRQICLVPKNSQSITTIKSLSCLTAQNFKTFSFCYGVNLKLIDRVLSGICSQGLWVCFELPNSQQIISYISSHLSHIEKNIQQNNFSIQLSKYSTYINQTNLPIFFIKVSNSEKQYLQKVPKSNFRQINLVLPDLKKMLSAETQIYFANSEIGQTIANLTTYCNKLLLQSQYQQFSQSFAFSILQQFKQKIDQTGISNNKKLIDIIQNKLSPRLKMEDQNSLKYLLQAYSFESEQKNKIKKLNTYQDSFKLKAQAFPQIQMKYGQIFTRDALILQDILNSTQNSSKKIAIVGDRLYGKTTIIQCLKEHVQKRNKTNISLSSIYFEAYTTNQLLVSNQKSHGIIATCIKPKMENWLILDGPVNNNYLQAINSLSNDSVLSNYGVLKEGQHKTKIKVFLQTTDLSQADPNFINQHSLFYLQYKRDRVHEVLKKSIENAQFHYFKQQARMEPKNDQTLHEVKAYKQVAKEVGLSKQSKDLLISQVTGLIEKFTTKGIVKIKSVQTIYQISEVQLAYRCSKLIQSILCQNESYLKDNEKINRRSIQKFALWALVWSFSTLVNPDDRQKFEKAISQTIKGNNCQQIFNSILCPGKGFQLFTFDSPRLQNILNSVPLQGDILNNINRYSALFHGDSLKSKNKYEHEFYFDDPHNIRVVTRESILFNYFSSLYQKNKVTMAIYGQANSGKKSIIQIFNKRNQEKIKNFSIRFKRHDNRHLAVQMQKPFTKFQTFEKTYLKPFDISKILHISIDDVSMLPEVLPSIELLRMVINTNSIYNQKSNLMHFRQFQLSLSIDQIKQQNYENVDFKRVLSRMFIIHTSRVTKQKLISIFTPILDNLCNDFLISDNGQRVRAFNNKNGDNLLAEATSSIYTFVEQLVSQLPCQSISDRNRKLLAVPKIKQMCHVVTNICRMKSLDVVEVDMDIQKCAEMWAHEVMRVFSQKFIEQKQKQLIVSEIKKHSLMHFKHNLSISSSGFIFTNIFKLEERENGNEGPNPYIKCEDLGQIQKQIQKIYENENYTLPAPIITDEFIEQLVKVYRVLSMECGHILIATPFRRSAKYIAKIAALFNKQSVYHDIEAKSFNFDLHIAPSIMRDIKACILIDIDMSSQQTLYQLACLMNKNYCEFSFKPQIKQKIRQKFITIAQQNMIKQNDNLQVSSLGKSKYNQEGAMQDSIKLIEIQNKIQNQFYQIAVDCFSQHFHVAAYISPCSSSTTKFLNQNFSITKHMQVLWYEFKDQVLFRTGERMIQQMVQKNQENKNLFDKCKIIYNTLSENMKNETDFLKFLSNCNRTYQIAWEQISQQIKIYQNCLFSLHNNFEYVESHKKQSSQIQNKIQDLLKQQEQISYKIKNAQQNGETSIEHLESEIKKIKIQKQNLDIKSRQLRTSQKIYQDLQNILPAQKNLTEKLSEAKQILSHIEQYSILVQSSLNYLNNYTKAEYIEQFKKWMSALNLEQVNQIKDILVIFQKVLGKQYVRIPGWQKHSQFTQLKGIHFCQNFISIPQSVFGLEPIVVKDDEGVLNSLLSNIGEKSSSIYVYSACKLINYIKNNNPVKANDNYYNNAREQIFGVVQRQIQKLLNQNKKQIKSQSKANQKTQQKNQFKKGIIILGQNYGWQPTRNDIQILERKILRDRKTLLQNRIIIQSFISPNITFFVDHDDLRCSLYESSKKVQFGEGFVLQNNKANTILREIDIKLDRKNISLIEAYAKVSESQQKNLQNITKIQNQLLQIQKIQKRTMAIIPQQYKEPSDLFLINWLIQYIGIQSSNKFSRIIEIYEFMKKCLLQLNYGRQTKINKMEQIDSEILRNWQNLIKANILFGKDLTVAEIMKFSMPIQQTMTLILIPNHHAVLDKLKGLQENSMYGIHWIDMYSSNLPDSFTADQKAKSMFICYNFEPLGASQHISQFIEHYNKFYNNYSPISIIVTNDSQSIVQSKAMNKKFRIIRRQQEVTNYTCEILMQIANMDVEHEFKTKKNALYETCKTTRKNVVDESEEVHEAGTDRTKDQPKLKLREKLKKFILMLIQSNMKKNKNTFAQQVSMKAIQSRLKCINNVNEVKAFIYDCIQTLPHQWELLLNYFNESDSIQCEQATKEIEDVYEQYLQLIQMKAQAATVSQKSETQYVRHEFIANPNYKQIIDRIDQLPFSFNVQQLSETNQPFYLQLISRTIAFNKQRYLLKKYLQECAKILKGTMLNYWSSDKQFGLWLPTVGYINKINNDYKIVKKGLQTASLLPGVDASSKDIKISNSQGVTQGQSILSIACQSFDYRNIEGITSKLLLTSVIKASRKLKIPLNKLNISWKLISSENLIEQNVCGELCLSLNSKVFKPELIPIHRALLPKQSKKVKLLMMVYDPTPIPTQVQLLPKSQNKKQKCKKLKTEKAQSTYIEKQVYTYQMAIKLSNGNIIDRIPIKADNGTSKYRIIIDEPNFMLF